MPTKKTIPPQYTAQRIKGIKGTATFFKNIIYLVMQV